MRRRFFFFLPMYLFAIKKKGIAESRYSAAKPRCPNTEPGGITVGSGKISIWKISHIPIILKSVEITITEYDTTLKNLSSPSITNKRVD